jgi:type I restriction enzyme S subunit
LGPRLLRGVNVNPGAINWDETVRLVESVPAPSRYKVEVGDVVIGMDRPFVTSGTRVAVVDAESAGSLLVQRVCRIRTSSASAAVLVAEALRSPRFRSHIETQLSGVSVPHLSDEQIGNFTVPDVVATGKAATSHQVLDATQTNRHLVKSMSSQIDLLHERRQALITAAVTGELEIPGVAA